MTWSKDEPAFPTKVKHLIGLGTPDEREVKYIAQGLTKRELFAAMAMMGFIANPQTAFSEHDLQKAAVQHADALLAELSKKETK